jgi:AraC-like DNA-binding protein
MFNSELLNNIILFGAVQGFIISCLLWFSKEKVLPSRLLSVLVFLISLASFNIYSINHNWYGINSLAVLFDAFIPMVIFMPVGPLIFFYVKSSIDPEFRITKKERIQFYPALLDFLQHIIATIYIVLVIFRLIKKTDSSVGLFIDTYNQYIDIPRWISVSLYLWFSFRYILLKKELSKNISDVVLTKKIKWLQQFISLFFAFQILWLLHLIPYIIPRFTNTLLDWGNWYPIYIPLSILVYWLGIRGYLMSNQTIVSSLKKPISQAELSLERIDEISTSLIMAMTNDKLYLNPDLNLSLLAIHTGISQKQISKVLNQVLFKSFNGFINEYRIKEVCKRLQSDESKRITITGLAYECGFNSQPTFQRSFKEIMGCSPKEFIIENASKEVNE